MSPERTRKDKGWFRLDRVIAGVGRIRVKSGRTLKQHQRVDLIVTKLMEQGQLEELRSLRAKRITSTQLVDADRRKAKAGDGTAEKLRAPLWSTAETVFRGPGATRDRYRRSIRAFRKRSLLSDHATIADLDTVPWSTVERQWGFSSADWNHWVRALSRLLTLHLGQHHPFRVGVLARVERRVEVEHEVNLTAKEFQAIIAPAPKPLRDCFWTLALTGMRCRSEFDKLTRADLGRYEVHISKTKNRKSHRIIPVDPRIWPHVLGAVPCPVSADYLTRAWRKLADQAKRPDLTLRDLRHCYGIWSLEAGITVNVLQGGMGHVNLSTTQRYVKQRAKAGHAQALADYVVPHVVTHRTKRA